MIRAISALAISLLLSGCAAMAPMASSLLPSGQPPLQAHTMTTVSLSKGNFTLVKTNVVGQSKGFSLLGVITLYPATVNKALDRLYAQASMEPGKPQTTAHLFIENSSSYFVLFAIPEVTVRADIVQFTPNPEPATNAPTAPIILPPPPHRPPSFPPSCPP